MTFFAGNALKVNEPRIGEYKRKAGKVGPALIFLATLTPVPDDPMIIPFDLMKYSPLKFFMFYFTGKMIVTTVGAKLGSSVSLTFIDLLENPFLVGISVVLTLVATYVLVKVDLEAVTERVLGWVRRKL